ncbi:MAG: hypothetical protein AB1486_00995 [Planctomycetota bacterium]
MTERLRHNDGGNPGPGGFDLDGEGSERLQRSQREMDDLLSAGDRQIQETLSPNSEQYLGAVRQHVGE